MKINIINDNTMLTVKTDCTLADIQRVATHKPEALTIVDADGKLIFSIGVAKTGCGCINNVGAEFAPVAATEGKAKITVGLPEVEDAPEYVAEQYASALNHIQTIERQITTALTNIEAKKSAIKQMIEVR